MSGDIINLRLARKAKGRATQELEAAANRAKYGRTREDRDTTVRAAKIAARRLDGHRLANDRLDLDRLDLAPGPDDGDAVQ